MNKLTRLIVWLRRIGHCRGFGIQSPSDYWLVRYVVNEHWPYYAYSQVGTNDDWLRRKLGRLYMRLANWRQPATIVSRDYEEYWQAGCKRATRHPTESGVATVELMQLDISEARGLLDRLEGRTDNRSVVVVEGLWRDWTAWRQLIGDRRTAVTLDLYFCGILLFDPKRTKRNYIINF